MPALIPGAPVTHVKSTLNERRSPGVLRSVVGTFLCGPEALGKVLAKKCAKYSDVDPRKTKFYFNKENF